MYHGRGCSFICVYKYMDVYVEWVYQEKNHKKIKNHYDFNTAHTHKEGKEKGRGRKGNHWGRRKISNCGFG